MTSATGFYWSIAELDRKKNIAFGYANLNNDNFAEWGYISIEELIDNELLEIETGSFVHLKRPLRRSKHIGDKD